MSATHYGEPEKCMSLLVKLGDRTFQYLGVVVENFSLIKKIDYSSAEFSEINICHTYTVHTKFSLKNFRDLD
jgi:hypothetical protein